MLHVKEEYNLNLRHLNHVKSEYTHKPVNNIFLVYESVLVKLHFMSYNCQKNATDLGSIEYTYQA